MRPHTITADFPSELLAPSPAGVWEISLEAAPERPALTGWGRPGDLSPLGQLVLSVWKGLAADFPGVTLGEVAVRRHGISGLLFVPWGSALGALVAQFKALAASTAAQAGLLLEPTMWQHGFRGRLIEDPIDLSRARTLLKAALP